MDIACRGGEGGGGGGGGGGPYRTIGTRGPIFMYMYETKQTHSSIMVHGPGPGLFFIA